MDGGAQCRRDSPATFFRLDYDRPAASSFGAVDLGLIVSGLEAADRYSLQLDLANDVGLECGGRQVVGGEAKEERLRLSRRLLGSVGVGGSRLRLEMEQVRFLPLRLREAAPPSRALTFKHFSALTGPYFLLGCPFSFVVVVEPVALWPPPAEAPLLPTCPFPASARPLLASFASSRTAGSAGGESIEWAAF